MAEAAPNDPAASQIAGKVADYITSIDRADPQMGATVWATTPGVSFIHPRGHEHGWNEVAQNFYGKTMGETFTKRTLKRVSDLDIEVYGDSAVVTFDWAFVATRKDNGEELHTTGRESQVFVNLPKEGWRLVHVHYSGPAVTGAAQGF